MAGSSATPTAAASGSPPRSGSWSACCRTSSRSVIIRQTLAASEALGTGLAGLLDNDRIGAVQLDRGGRVLEANALALEILRRGDGLVEGDGTLDAVLPADRSRLRRLLARALPDFLGEAPGGGSMTVQRPSGRSRLGLHVMPVGDAAADFGGRRVAVLVLLVDPARRPPINAQRVAVTLGLTASEGRMAALLAEGLKMREIATVQGWSDGVCALADQAGLPEARRVGAGRAGAPRPGGGRPAGGADGQWAAGATAARAALAGPQTEVGYLPDGRILQASEPDYASPGQVAVAARRTPPAPARAV